MILGYTIMEPDSGQNMFSNMMPDECSKFSNIYDLNIVDPNFRLKKRKKNIISTYEGFTLVSKKFIEFCESNKYPNLEFVSLPNDHDFFWFKIHTIVEFDTVAGRTRFINFNSNCNGYEEIIGATPVCLRNKNRLSDNFFRTDVCFGGYAGKSPSYVVGEETAKKLKTAGFKEIYFQEILDKYEWQEVK